MYKIINFSNEEKYIKEFIGLPSKLYLKNEIMQNKSEELSLLRGVHILSKYFKIYPFLVIDDSKGTIARAAVTIYPNDDTVYLGFFECIENTDISDFFIKKIEEFVLKLGYKKIIAPVDASFWIRYRFKINNFEDKFSGEPYNKAYYYEMFKRQGYNVLQNYTSNIYSRINNLNSDDKLEKRFELMKNKGYKFENLNKKFFNKQLKDIGKMILDLYSDFPAFKMITLEEFCQLFKDLKKIINYKMVKLSYYNNEMVGFLVCIPDYNNLFTSKNYIKIMYRKLLPKRYILMYLGVKRESKGLGSALGACIAKELIKNKRPSIGALIKNENANIAYFKQGIESKNKYVLLKKILCY